MSNKTGLDPLETAVLVAIHNCGATFDAPHRKNIKFVDYVESHFDYGQSFAFEVLVVLSRSWEVPLTLVDFHGNGGAPGYPPAPADVTESRLSKAGQLAVTVEQSSAGALPIRLINGTLYRGGKAPAFEPLRVIDCFERILTDPAVEDGDIIDMIGSPFFFGNPIFDGDIGALYDGETVECSLTARISIVGTSARGVRVAVTNFPPLFAGEFLAEELEHHTSQDAWDLHNAGYYEEEPRLPIKSVSHRPDEVEIKIERGVDVDMFVSALAMHRLVREEFKLALPKPLPTLFREWAREHASPETMQNLAKLRKILS